MMAAASLGLITLAYGVASDNGAEICIGIFLLVMALFGALERDHGINKNASYDLEALNRLRLGAEDRDRRKTAP